MATGLIGYTGFVGSNLAKQAHFDKFYNSKNIDAIRGEHFETLVCAGVPAVKWWSNKHPEEDWLNIGKLLSDLEKVTTDRFVLISTVDVFRDPAGVDEASAIDAEALEPYGKHRRRVEEFVESQFEVYHIIRLPGLFGDGLKKNIIYDFIHDNQIENIHAESQYQFYSLARIGSDMRTAIANELRIIHFATEPVKVHEVAASGFDFYFEQTPDYQPARYDMRTNHAHLYGEKGSYLASKRSVLDQIRTFVQAERKKMQK